MANETPGRRTTRAQAAGKKKSKTPPTSPPNNPTTQINTKRKKKEGEEEKKDLLQVEEIAKRVKRASIIEEKEGEKTKEKEETNEEEDKSYAEINSVLKRLHFEARERRRTSMSPWWEDRMILSRMILITIAFTTLYERA